jgi:hypothetical protein
MDLSLDELKKTSIKNLKKMAGEAGLSGYSKITSADKADLAKKIYRAYHKSGGSSPRSKTSRKSSRSPRKSASPKRKSRSRSPKRKSTSPKRKSRSPKRKSTSPKGRGGCVSPARCATNSSYKKDHVESVARKCGISLTKDNGKDKTRKELCEDIARAETSSSPNRKSRSPNRKSRSPNRKSRSPKKSPSPKRKSRSPKSKSRSPSPAKDNLSKSELMKSTVVKLKEIAKGFKITPIPKRKEEIVDAIVKASRKSGSPTRKSSNRKSRSPKKKSPSPKSKSPSPKRESSRYPKKKRPSPNHSSPVAMTLTQLRKLAVSLGMTKSDALNYKAANKAQLSEWVRVAQAPEESEQEEEISMVALKRMDQSELVEYIGETYGMTEDDEGEDLDYMDVDQLLEVIRLQRVQHSPSKSPSPRRPPSKMKTPSPSKSPSPRRPPSKMKTPSPSPSPVGACGGYSFDELKSKSSAELIGILKKIGINEGVPKSKDSKAQYICDSAKYGKCSPDSPCPEGSQCDMSNDPGTCISDELADKRTARGYTSFVYKGRKIIGTSDAIDSLRAKLSLGTERISASSIPIDPKTRAKSRVPKPASPPPRAQTPPRARRTKPAEGHEIPDPADILAELQQGHGAADLGTMDELQTKLYKCLGLLPASR